MISPVIRTFHFELIILLYTFIFSILLTAINSFRIMLQTSSAKTNTSKKHDTRFKDKLEKEKSC